MRSKIIEASDGQLWLMASVAVLEPHELARTSRIPEIRENFGDVPLMKAMSGLTNRHVWVLDLSTGEGAAFRMGGLPQWDVQHASSRL